MSASWSHEAHSDSPGRRGKVGTRYEDASQVQDSSFAWMTLSELQLLADRTLISEDVDVPIDELTKPELVDLLEKTLGNSSGFRSIAAAPGLELDTLAWSSITFERLLANTGAFGEVWAGKCHGTNCAIKRFKKIGEQLKMKTAELFKEIDIMRRIRHPNVVSLLGISSCPTTGEIVVVMELMQGTLNEKRRANPNMSQFERLTIAKDIARGLSWLHGRQPPILHLDLKFDNVLYDAHGLMKVSDFGLSAFQPQDYVVSGSRLPGNIGHMAPEIIRKEGFNTAADVFAFAIMLWEIMRGLEWEQEILEHMRVYNIVLRRDSNIHAVVKDAIANQNFRPVIPADWLPELRTALELAWHADMELRPSMLDMVTKHLPAIENATRTQYIAHHLGFDPVAQRLWTAYFFKNVPNAVPADQFLRAFYAEMGFVYPLANPNHDEQLSYLKVALDVYDSDESPTTATTKVVTIRQFAQLALAFGPLLPKNAFFFKKLESVIDADYFFPDKEAAGPSFLLGQNEGVFMVRFVHDDLRPPSAFTLSVVTNGTIEKRTIHRDPATSEFYIPDVLGGRKFPELDNLINDPDVRQAIKARVPRQTIRKAAWVKTKPIVFPQAYVGGQGEIALGNEWDMGEMNFA